MPVFQYSATDKDGQNIKGTAVGSSLELVSQDLAKRGLTILNLSLVEDMNDPVSKPQEPIGRQTPVPPPLGPRSNFETQVAGPLVSSVPPQALQFFFRQLGTLLNAGINPADAMETLSRQTQSAKLASILRETKDHVIAGRPLSAGFQRYPEAFNPLMMSMIRVGEEGGFLAEQCVQLSEYIQRDIELKNMIKRETAQPKLTMGCSVFIILGANMAIQSLAPGGVTLPVPWLVWFFVIAFAVGSYVFVKLGLPRPEIRQRFDETVLKIPGVGGMVLGFAMAKFGRAFGALYRGGVAMPKALALAGDACGNESVRARIYPAVDRLKEGEGITDTLASTGAFSPLVLDMTRTGEMTGDMDQMLVKMAEYYEDEGATQAQMAAKIIGVVCFILVAIYVLFILITGYSAIFGQAMKAGEG